MTRSQFIDVKHHLLFSLQRSFLSAIKRVLLLTFKSSVVVIAVQQIWYRAIVFFDSTHDFLIESLLKLLCALHDLLTVGILTI